jgi:hypothetical protein
MWKDCSEVITHSGFVFLLLFHCLFNRIFVMAIVQEELGWRGPSHQNNNNDDDN